MSQKKKEEEKKKKRRDLGGMMYLVDQRRETDSVPIMLEGSYIRRLRVTWERREKALLRYLGTC